MHTFTPSAAQYRRYAFSIIPFAIILLVIDYFRFRDNPIPFGAVVIVAFGFLAIYLGLYFRNTRIESESHSLVVRNLVGRVRTYGFDQLDRVVLLRNYTQAGSRAGNGPRLMVLDRDGKAVLTWYSQFWNVEQMQSLASTLSMPVDDIPEPVGTKQLRVRYPNSIGWVSAHPYLFALILTPVILIVVVVIVIGVLGSN